MSTLIDLPNELHGDVAPPTIATSRWSGLLPANKYTLRAALFTCAEAIGSELKIYRSDRRILMARREKTGWEISLATDGSKRDKAAVRSHAAVVRRIRMNWWKLYFSGGYQRVGSAMMNANISL
jgi:hypothetical protein